jgi:peptidyl-prolyl cis-trans isomerase C
MKSKGPLTLILICSFFAAEFLIGADTAKKNPEAPASAEAKPAEAALPEVVAVVEGVEIKNAELNRALAAILGQQGRTVASIPAEQKPTVYRMVLDQLIVDRLIAKRSAEIKVSDAEIEGKVDELKKNFGTEEEFQTQLQKTGQTLDKLKENIRANLRQQHWVDEQLKGKDEVADAEAEDYYKKNPEKFQAPEKIRASHILLALPQDAKPETVQEKEKAAKAVLDRVKKGEDFAKVAEEVSDDPSAKQNKGDLDFFSREQMVPEFADAAFKLKQDEVSSAPVRSQFGYHIIKQTGRKDAETITFDKAKPQLMAYLKNQKKQGEISKVVKAMREKADVKVNLPDIPAPAKPGTPEPAPAK